MNHPALIKMPELAQIAAKNNIEVNSILEIGSLHGHDAHILEQHFQTNDVTIFEAVPQFADKIKARYPYFKVHNQAVSDEVKTASFYVIAPGEGNQGVSSPLKRNDNRSYQCVLANYITMAHFIRLHETQYDLVKIDTEGTAYQVLKGFGDHLKEVKAIHVECEHAKVWENQYLYCDVEGLLKDAGFVCAAIKMAWPQSDSVWIRKDLYNGKWWEQ